MKRNNNIPPHAFSPSFHYSPKRFSEKKIQDALYTMASTLWTLIPHDDRAKLGKTKAEFVADFYKEHFG